MPNAPVFLHVEVRNLRNLRVIHFYCLFRSKTSYPDKIIRPVFRKLRLQVIGFGLNLDILLHVGIPDIVDGRLVSYDFCIFLSKQKNKGLRVGASAILYFFVMIGICRNRN